MTEEVLKFYANPPLGDPDRPVPDFYDELSFGEAARAELVRIEKRSSRHRESLLVLAVAAAVVVAADPASFQFYGPALLGSALTLLYMRLTRAE